MFDVALTRVRKENRGATIKSLLKKFSAKLIHKLSYIVKLIISNFHRIKLLRSKIGPSMYYFLYGLDIVTYQVAILGFQWAEVMKAYFAFETACVWGKKSTAAKLPQIFQLKSRTLKRFLLKYSYGQKSPDTWFFLHFAPLFRCMVETRCVLLLKHYIIHT